MEDVEDPNRDVLDEFLGFLNNTEQRVCDLKVDFPSAEHSIVNDIIFTCGKTRKEAKALVSSIKPVLLINVHI